MDEYSLGAGLAMQIASREAHRARFRKIERDHLLIALLKVHEAIRENETAWVRNQDKLKALRAEASELDAPLKSSGVDLQGLRRKLRSVHDHGESESELAKPITCSAASLLTLERARLIANVNQSRELQCLHLLVALLETPTPGAVQAIGETGVDLPQLLRSVQNAARDSQLKVAPASKMEHTAAPARQTFLEQFGVDLTKLAREGKIQPLIGRRKELLQLVRTLTRRTKNNPILLGEPGVGKTALVRGLALRIAHNVMGSELRGSRIIELNLGTLIAGAKYRGEFEERLTRIIEEVKSSRNTILFLDEIHTVVGAGSAGGGLDAASILNPALSNGDIQCIGATSHEAYQKHFEKDSVFARLFQPIILLEPSAEDALRLLEGLRSHFEEHHQVRITPDALKSAVDYSIRYLADRRLPDKALDLVDEACARINVTSLSFQQTIDGEVPVRPVTADTVAEVLADWTGIPVGRLTGDSKASLQNLGEVLQTRVIGQHEAVETVCGVVKMARAGLRDPRRPVGVFLFVGPTGVGKTELCRALADVLYGSEREMIRLDMSEYMEKHNVARLIGAPPGYVGHDEEGQLTGKLRRKPNSLVLFDEVEKAHPEVLDLFLQLFDDGRLTDARGRVVDGRHALFIMTSNVSSGVKAAKHLGFVNKEKDAEPHDDVRNEILDDLRKSFRPEFLNRIDEVVAFRSLDEESVARIARKLLEELRTRAMERSIDIEFDANAVDLLAVSGFDPANGARPMARTIERMVGRPLSEAIVGGRIQAGDRVRLSVRNKSIDIERIEGD